MNQIFPAADSTSCLLVPTPGVTTPAPTSRSSGGDMGLDAHVFNRLLKERIIFLGSPVMD